MFKTHLKTQQQPDKTRQNTSYTSDSPEFVKNVGLLIEAIPKNLRIKTKFHKQLAKFASEKTVFATNSSMFLLSLFAKAAGRSDKFLALHFDNTIWIHNTAEIMRHPKTDPKAIGMLTLHLFKEQPRYILNSLLMTNTFPWFPGVIVSLNRFINSLF
ncbi:3-hydroxyacyl-CoA dehydrogenase NAD-binding domain-containing protein [Formosa sp. L2A11]|uniref:3-hydroxyacyl-CoA dehydrogenase NAD-binding domain-containing protein n=1 Tax=Formosa sp. L2A11 TaxID=2686363 RepID=UPI0018EF26C3|nr:3-hydroxyacyl-CoA dehydrogenase NAD-binding domain-containing protein [Formosa sp. L2A11]